MGCQQPPPTVVLIFMLVPYFCDFVCVKKTLVISGEFHLPRCDFFSLGLQMGDFPVPIHTLLQDESLSLLGSSRRLGW